MTVLDTGRPTSSPTSSPLSSIDEVFDRSMRWLAERLDWFSDERWNQHFPPMQPPTQPLLELQLLSRVLGRLELSEHAADQSSALRREAVDEVRNGCRALAQDALADPGFARTVDSVDAQFPYQVWLLGMAEDPGEIGARHRQRLEQLLDLYGAALPALDWTPANAIELDYVCGLAGLPSPTGDFLAHRGERPYAELDPTRTTEADGYVLTHELFYGTDLAGHRLPIATTERRRLQALVRLMLAVQAAEDQLDLCSELLFSLVALRPDSERGSGRLAGRVWRRLAEAQLPSGGVPGPPWDAEIAAERDEDEAEAYEFRTCYHTTLVTALAGAAELVARSGQISVDGGTVDVGPDFDPLTAITDPLRRELGSARLKALAWLRAHPSPEPDPSRPEPVEGDHPQRDSAVLPGAAVIAARAGQIRQTIRLTTALVRTVASNPGCDDQARDDLAVALPALLSRIVVAQHPDGGWPVQLEPDDKTKSALEPADGDTTRDAVILLELVSAGPART